MSQRSASVSMRPRIALVSTAAESRGIRLRPPPQSAQPAVDAASATARSAVSNGRKGSKKTRTGCITCKCVRLHAPSFYPVRRETVQRADNQPRIRRIKCDESKPACLRCQKTGRQCDGYRPSPGSRTTSSQLLPDVRDVQGSSEPQPWYSVSVTADWSPSEKRAFHFYQQFTAKGLFSSISADFWTKVIPALCFHEPAIRHAVFAIGNLQETRYLRQCPSDGPVLSNPFAAVQYGKALRYLQTWTFPAHDVLAGTVATVLPLLSCALFICIEFMLSDASAAHIHIGQGRRLLAHFDAGSGRSPAAELVRRELVPIFTRLSLASFLLGSVPDPIPSQLRWTASHSLKSNAHVYAFDTLIEAAQTMYEIMDDACEFGRETRLWAFSAEAGEGGSPEQRACYEERQEAFLRRLRNWHGAFRSLERRDSSNDHTGLVAMMYFHMVKVFVGVSLEPQGHRELAYDNHVADFANIVILAGRLHILEESETEPGTRFSFEPGFIPPLNLAAAKCRHPHIRRAALALLTRRATLQQTENMWDSNQVQRVAERAILLEESGGWDFVDPYDSARGVYQQDDLSFFDGGPGHEGRDLSTVSGDSAERNSFRHISSASQRWTTADPPAWPCVPANRPMAWHTTPDEALTEMTTWKQPTDDMLDPGAAWVDAHPLAAEHDIPSEHRIHSVIIKPQGPGRSLLKLFVLPDADDPSRWGFFEEQMAVEEGLSCT